MKHKFVEDPTGQDRRCQECGASYHCGGCGEGSGMFGHARVDDRGHFMACCEPERAERLKAKIVIEREIKERAEYERLKKKYGPG